MKLEHSIAVGGLRYSKLGSLQLYQTNAASGSGNLQGRRELQMIKPMWQDFWVRSEGKIVMQPSDNWHLSKSVPVTFWVLSFKQ